MSTMPPDETPGYVQITPELWLDLEGGVIIHQQKEIMLTAREVSVLRILIQTMCSSRCYLSAEAIARRINLPDTQDREHSIEQTVSTIRRKLGEVVRSPRILRGRRGFGYRIFPEYTSQ